MLKILFEPQNWYWQHKYLLFPENYDPVYWTRIGSLEIKSKWKVCKNLLVPILMFSPQNRDKDCIFLGFKQAGLPHNQTVHFRYGVRSTTFLKSVVPTLLWICKDNKWIVKSLMFIMMRCSRCYSMLTIGNDIYSLQNEGRILIGMQGIPMWLALLT